MTAFHAATARRGMDPAALHMAQAWARDGRPVSAIAKQCGLTVEELKKWLAPVQPRAEYVPRVVKPAPILAAPVIVKMPPPRTGKGPTKLNTFALPYMELLGARPVANRLLALIEDAYGIDHATMTGPSRFYKYSRPRQVAFYLFRHFRPDISLPSLGRMFNRDHTTVLHGVRMVADRIETDPDVAVEVAELIGLIEARIADARPFGRAA